MNRPTLHCPGPMSRRRFLQLGSLALGGVGLNGLSSMRLEAADGSAAGPDTSVIFVWLPGGPPHMETYDMKPDAPAEYRGEFRPIKTNVPGIDVCEHLPLHAKIADKYTLIRSIAHNFADHGGGHKRFLTGRDPREPTGFVNDYPMVGSMVAREREGRHHGLPNYINVCEPGRTQIDTFSFGSAYLGPATHPFTLGGDPSEPGFKVPNIGLAPQMEARLPERVRLLEQLDQPPAGIDPNGVEAMTVLRQKALTVMTSDTVRRAFDLGQEPAALRQRYGMHAWGQRALLARRLVEAGASFVTVVMENPYRSGVPFPADGVYNWDSHAVNCHMFNDLRNRLPIYDRAVTALVEDLYARGLDRKVLLIVTGEFGRTPRISHAAGSRNGVQQPGRDHWPSAMSVLVAGGGMKVGQIVGSTNSRGEHPKDRPLTPNDLWATMFRHLGIDYQRTEYLDPTGRPLPILPYGEPIAELV